MSRGASLMTAKSWSVPTHGDRTATARMKLYGPSTGVTKVFCDAFQFSVPTPIAWPTEPAAS